MLKGKKYEEGELKKMKKGLNEVKVMMCQKKR